MTEVKIVHTKLTDGVDAGKQMGVEIREAFKGTAPDAVILFASPDYDYADLLQSFSSACEPATLVGCSSPVEFTRSLGPDKAACAVAIRSKDMHFSASVGRGMRADEADAARQLVAGLRGLETHDYVYRSALILTDALAGYVDSFVERLTALTYGTYSFFGGGAADDVRFYRTDVFMGTEAIEDAAVALEILSNKPLGIGVSHGWRPVGPPMRVTEADGTRLISLDGIVAAERFQEYAEETGQSLDINAPLPFFLHNVIGIETETQYKLRVPLSILEDGAIACAAEVPLGATVRFMRTSASSATEAAADATRDALRQLNGANPKLGIFFDCVATRLRMGREFGFELEAVQQALGQAEFIGCNTYGQIARGDGQFSGFHNCTAVVCVLPE